MSNEVLDIVRDECQKLDKRLAYIGINSLCVAEQSPFNDIVIKLQITNIDGTRRYIGFQLGAIFHTITKAELRQAIRKSILQNMAYRILDEEGV